MPIGLIESLQSTNFTVYEIVTCNSGQGQCKRTFNMERKCQSTLKPKPNSNSEKKCNVKTVNNLQKKYNSEQTNYHETVSILKNKSNIMSIEKWKAKQTGDAPKFVLGPSEYLYNFLTEDWHTLRVKNNNWSEELNLTYLKCLLKFVESEEIRLYAIIPKRIGTSNKNCNHIVMKEMKSLEQLFNMSRQR